MLSTRLAEAGPALKCLDERLADLVRVLPPAHLGLLREVRLWIEPGPARKATAWSDRDAAAFYIPLDRRYDRAHGVLPEKQGGVVVFAEALLTGPAAAAASETEPGWLLHEAAHALQDRLIGLNDAATRAAYRQSIDRALYDDVATREYQAGGGFLIRRGLAYARTNPVEYFAELSTAYLNLPTLSYPFSREELRTHDTAGYALMESFWRSMRSRAINESPVPVSVDRVAQTGRRFRLFDLMPGKEMEFDGWGGMALIATDQLDGTEYRFGTPARDGRAWRLSLRPTGSSAAAVSPPAPPSAR